MARREFSAKTKDAAWERAGGICEAEGPMYGLPDGMRCTRDLNFGVRYDHDDPDYNSKDNSLENCRALCPACDRHKTTTRDRPLIDRTKRQKRMARGIKKDGHRPMRSGWKPRDRDVNSDLEEA